MFEAQTERFLSATVRALFDCGIMQLSMAALFVYTTSGIHSYTFFNVLYL
jgi:hypothetical protein